MPTEDEWADADIAADEEAGHHLTRPPEQGVKDMERRIRALNARLAIVRDRGDEQSEQPLIEQVQKAKLLLDQYQALLKGRN